MPQTTTSDAAETQAVDLDTFMTAIFGGCVGVPIVAAIDYKGFLSQRYVKDKARGDQLYFCISTVTDIPRTAILRRQNVDLVRTYCVVLDDIGTKCPVPKVQPSWILESSPGNFQYGYRLEGGAAPAEAAALIEALIAAGHTDPGAGRAERVMRVPGSLNAKPTANGWRAVVRSWHPKLTYKSTAALAEAFGVTPGAPQTARVEAPPLPRSGDVSDRVFDWLVGHDMVIDGPNPRKWYRIICPWQDEHETPPYDEGTDYLPGLPGAFKCLHGHCAKRTTADLKDWIWHEDPEADIGVISHELALAVGTKLRALAMPSLSLRERLGLAIRGVALWPGALPDATTTAAGNVSMKQTATELRVEHVMKMIGASVRRNAMAGTIQINMKDYCSDDDNSAAGMATLVHACDRCGMTNANLVKQAVMNIAMTNSYNPAEDWILSKLWDGIDRFPALAASITLQDHVRETWKHVALRRWSLQVVTAVHNYRLDVKAHPIGFVLVLQGEQGLNKSFWISSLMPAGFVTLGLSLRLDRNERDSAARATGTPIGELAELDASFKHSDISALKNFLTTPIDAYRPPYGDRTLRVPRCTAFAGTINPSAFLQDPTGARRFWPLAVAGCNPQHGVDMQQYWAQMHHYRIVKNEQYWLAPDEEILQAEAISGHEIASEITEAVDDLVRRRAAMGPNDKMSPANMKMLLAHYNIRFLKVNSADLQATLERAKFERCKSAGIRGFKVPDFQQVLTPAQLAGLKLVK